MSRTLIPGAREYDGGKAIPFCSGEGCRQGRAPHDCDCELANAIPPRSWVPVRPAITVHRIPLTRRVRRFLRALVAFLLARKVDLS